LKNIISLWQSLKEKYSLISSLYMYIFLLFTRFCHYNMCKLNFPHSSVYAYVKHRNTRLRINHRTTVKHRSATESNKGVFEIPWFESQRKSGEAQCRTSKIETLNLRKSNLAERDGENGTDRKSHNLLTFRHAAHAW
jgi:hypothetical protein